MKYLLCTLTCILSVGLFKASSLFADETLKKELGICGKTLSVVYKIQPSADPQFVAVNKLDDEFCDYGRYEENANTIISLYNSKDQLVYDKHIFINPVNIAEVIDPKKPGKLQVKKIEKPAMSRIVKFPLSEKMGEIKSYKVEWLPEKKSYSKKMINWK